MGFIQEIIYLFTYIYYKDLFRYYLYIHLNIIYCWFLLNLLEGNPKDLSRILEGNPKVDKDLIWVYLLV